jgi:hypothetical protein
MKHVNLKPLIAGTIHVDLSSDRSTLIGHCPTCGSQVSVGIHPNGTFGGLVACMRCKEIYRVEAEAASPTDGSPARGFRISYAIEGAWDVSAIMEYLFDNVGTVNPLPGGFVCEPDEHLDAFPTITVHEGTRTVEFSLFGEYREREAGAIINQVVTEFGGRFQLGLLPLVLECWEYRNEAKALVLKERRPLGTLRPHSTKESGRLPLFSPGGGPRGGRASPSQFAFLHPRSHHVHELLQDPGSEPPHRISVVVVEIDGNRAALPLPCLHTEG